LWELACETSSEFHKLSRMSQRGDWRKQLRNFITESFKQSLFGAGNISSIFWPDGRNNRISYTTWQTQFRPISGNSAECWLQPVPWKMRLRMLVGIYKNIGIRTYFVSMTVESVGGFRHSAFCSRTDLPAFNCSKKQHFLRRIFWAHKKPGNFVPQEVTRFSLNPPIPLLHPTEWWGDLSQLQTQNHDLNLYREIQRNSNSIKISIWIWTARYRGIWVSRFRLVDKNLPNIQDFD